MRILNQCLIFDKDNESILFGENEEYSKALFGDYKTYYACLH